MIESLANIKIRLLGLPELQNNLLAWLFAKYPNLNITNKESLYLDLVPYYSQYKESDVEPIQIEEATSKDEKPGSDCRISWISI